MRVLIADDEPVSRSLLESTLARWGYDVVVASDGRQALEVLQKENAPRLAILDWVMPGMDGPQVCREVRSWQQPYIYLLLLTVKFQKQDVVRGLEAGADDFLTKPFDAQELSARLRAGKRVLELQETLRIQATHDPLTGLWNRAATFDLLRRELNRSRRQGSPVGIVMADLDHFKLINDTYGHMAGDAVLREVAEKIVSCVRSYDIVGRFGGEEFLIIFPACSALNAVGQAERLRERISAAPLGGPEYSIPVTLSLGVAGSDEFRQDMELLVRGADAALYRAKEGGRNRVERARAGEIPLSAATRASS